VWESWPSWSPDGLQIVVTVDAWRTNLHDLRIVAADGSGSTALTDDRAYEFFPMWAAA
jgi:Tol biopolymer transport system component